MTYTSVTDAVTFTGAVDLAGGGATTVTTGAGAGDDITFTSTIDGNLRLNLNPGALGDVTIQGAVGGTTALDTFDITDAAEVSLMDITVQGATGADRIVIGSNTAISAAFTLNGDLDTSNSGASAATGNINLNAAGGVDIIKDDELLADPTYCPVVDRVKEVMAGVKRAYEETGEKTLYCVNITDEVDRMVDKAKRVIELGCNAIMVNFTPVGLSAVRMLAEHPDINVPIWAHPAYAGAVYQSHYSGLSSWLHLGKLLRIAGADMLVYASAYGKVTILKERYVRVAQALQAPFYHLKPILPAPGAGMNHALVYHTLADIGPNSIIGAGGAIHGHPMGAQAGAHSMRLVIDAAIADVPLDVLAAEHEVVRVALERWGATSEDVHAFTLRQ